MLKQRLLILAIVYTVILAVLSLIRLNDLPDLGFTSKDKVFHFLAYGLLMLLWHIAFITDKKLKYLIRIAISAIIYGIVLEILQSELTSYRTSSVFDAIANALGVISMCLLIILVKRKTRVKKI